MSAVDSSGRVISAALVLVYLSTSPWAALAQATPPSDQDHEESSAIESSETERQVEFFRHRFDFGFETLGIGIGIEGFEDEHVSTLSLGYQWVPNPQHALFVTANVVDSEIGGEVEADGLSDTLLLYSFSPSEQMTAKPWVPKRVGTGIGFLVPTGDAEIGTGLDSWVLLLYLGIPVRITDKLFFLPSGTYYDSFSEGDFGIPFSGWSIEAGFVWLPTGSWWFNFTPSVFHQNGSDTEVLIYRFQVGREFGSRWGASIEYAGLDGDLEVIFLGFQFDSRLAVNAHYSIP